MAYAEKKFNQGEIEANGIRFSYIHAGDRRDPLVLCLHGFPDTNRTYRLLLPKMAEYGFFAVAPNMRGVWPSQASPDGCYKTASMALDALALIHALGKREAMIVGHGWGAIAAIGASQIAYDGTRLRQIGLAPKHITRVVAISESYGETAWEFCRSDPDEKKLSRILNPLLEEGAAWKIRKGNLNYLKQLRSAWSPGWRGSSYELERVIQAYAKEGSLEAAISCYRSQMRNGHQRCDQMITTIQRLMDRTQVPADTLLLHGENDRRHTPDYFKTMPIDLFLGRLEEEIILKSGHFPHLENPEIVNERIIEFLEQG